MKMQTLLFSLMGVAMVGQTAWAQTSQKPTPECDRKGDRKAHLAQKLNLSDAQKKQFDQIHQKYEGQLQDRKKQLITAREDLGKSIKTPQKGKAYQSTLLAKFKNVQRLKTELHARRFQMALEIREILNEEQLSKFGAMHERRHGFKRGASSQAQEGKSPQVSVYYETDQFEWFN